MNLKQLSENITCERINFLNKKYDINNSYLYANRLICNSANRADHVANNQEDLTYLKSSYICKKNCMFKPPPTINSMDILNTNMNIPTIFNVGTRIKTIL